MTTVPLFCRVETLRKGDKVVPVLVPCDRVSSEKLAKVKPGRTLMVETESARNPKQLRLYWAMMHMIAENVDRFDDAKHVSDEIKINTGHVERRQINVPGLGVVFQEWPASIAYASMSQGDFAKWFERAIDYITTSIWPDMPAETIRAELAEMLGVDDWPSPTQAKENA